MRCRELRDSSQPPWGDNGNVGGSLIEVANRVPAILHDFVYELVCLRDRSPGVVYELRLHAGPATGKL